MMRRRWILQGISAENGWHKKSIIPSSDLLKGNDIVSAIKAELPEGYHYAIALRNTVGELENYAFVCCSIISTSTYALGIRNKNDGSAFQPMTQINGGSVDCKIRSGEQIDIYWREEAITTDEPTTSWEYETLQPGALSNAQSVKDALVGIGAWTAIVSVADIDFNTLPLTNNTLCTYCAVDSTNVSCSWERVRNGAYNTGSSTQASYDLVVESATKLANFYLI